MKRKVVQIAGFTKVISLPSEWVKRLNIKKGDELDIKESESSLTIAVTQQNKEARRAHIDASKLNPQVIWPILSLLYKTGYEEIKISGINKEIMKVVHAKVLASLLGFEVIEQTAEYCIIKNMSEGKSNNLQSVMRKIFLVTLSQARQSLEFIKTNDVYNYNEVLNLESTNDRLTNYSERLLNDEDIDLQNRYEYFIVWLLENVGDGYKNLCEAAKTNSKINASPAVISVFERVNALFDQLYALYYKFTLEEFSEFSSALQETMAEISKLLRLKKNPDPIILAHLLYIVQALHDFIGAMLHLKADLSEQIRIE
jgi:phosphate uptake regulator